MILVVVHRLDSDLVEKKQCCGGSGTRATKGNTVVPLGRTQPGWQVEKDTTATKTHFHLACWRGACYGQAVSRTAIYPASRVVPTCPFIASQPAIPRRALGASAPECTSRPTCWNSSMGSERLGVRTLESESTTPSISLARHDDGSCRRGSSRFQGRVPCEFF